MDWMEKSLIGHNLWRLVGDGKGVYLNGVAKGQVVQMTCVYGGFAVSDGVTTIVVLDTETTDMDPDKGAQICEIGWVVLEDRAGKWTFACGDWTYVATDAPMHPAARAAHHIHPSECKTGAPNCVSIDSILHDLLAAEEPGEMMYAAHNAPFDQSFLPELTLPWIDTCQCARHLWPESPRFSNQVLRYYLDAEPPVEFLQGLDPHRAMYDAACTAAILARALLKHSPTELLRLSTTPVLQKTCNFGKHAGKPWANIPMDYLNWLVRASDLYQTDPELRYTVDYYLTHKVTALPI